MAEDERGGEVGGVGAFADKLTVAHRREPAGSVDHTVESLIRSAPVVGTADMSVREAAQLMTERNRDHVLIPLRDGGFGVLTDAILRERVVAAGASLDTPVTELTPRRATVVAPHVAATDALTTILENDLTALPVVDAGGVVRGVVAPSDFVSAPGGPSVALREQISRARDVVELQERASRVPYLIADLVRREQPAHSVTTMASLVVDAVVRRALELVLAFHPELDPTKLTWMSLGSNARRETVLSSDIDSAASFSDDVSDEQVQAYRVAFGEVDTVLRGAGMDVDDNGAIASMPLFSRTHAKWRAAAERWLAEPLENKGMILTSLLIDARPIWGDEGLPAVGEVFADLRRHRGTLNLLLAEALATRAKMRSMRDVLTRRGDDFDVKEHAIGPLVNFARWAALSVGSTQLDTRGRLRAASGTELLSDDQADTLIEVFEILQRIRLNYQVAQFDRGEDVSDVLDMKRLSPLDRSMVAQAVREIAGVQRRAANRAHYLPVGSV
ncbi:putative nucleotidyltransferase substrate binding domain-containing protein [Gordonia jacobaea]|uniref:putative nucleotidyltransferase substrate binding domain-containing protein n=1 Tax=Gordonia jacobaea TaxID=122202 RepID=UPI003D7261FD